VLSLADASVLVAARGRLMQALPEGGAMVAVAAPETDVLPLLADGVGIAAVNGPRSVVVSGAESEVLRVAEHFAQAGVRTTRLKVSHAFHSVLMEPMLEEFRTVLDGLTYGSARIPVVSTVTGEVGKELDAPAYWVRQVRDAVRFADAVTTLTAQGVTRFLEIGPDAVLTPLIDSDHAIPALRRNQEEPTALVSALGRLHATGAAVDWTAFFTGSGTGARRVDLPTYAFQRQRYWTDPQPESGDAESAGLDAVDHPMLGAAVEFPDSAQVVLTARLSAQKLPWLVDHQVLGSTVLPGTGFVELAARAAELVGCEVVEELNLQAPLVVPEHGAVRLHVAVAAPAADGTREISVYSRGQDAPEEDRPWILHAEGLLSHRPVPAAFELSQWPPAGATAMDVDGAYVYLDERGYGYGPAFQGLRAAWRRGDELFAEVALPEGARGDAQRYGVHPALLDAAMHVLTVADDDPAGERTMLPFSWAGVSAHARGAGSLRVRLSWTRDNAVSMAMADMSGAPVLSVEALSFRPVSAAQLKAAASAPHGSLFQVEWTDVPLAGAAPAEVATWDEFVAGDDAPDAVVLDCGSAAGDVPTAARSVAHRVLDAVQKWLADERSAVTRLVVVTRGAVAAHPGEVPALEQAPVWGLVRAAQAENPGRIVLVDVGTALPTRGDAAAADLGGMLPALSAVVASGEPEAALRDGSLRVPRLVGAPVSEGPAPAGTDGAVFDGPGTVLITGGTGGIGALVARHLVTEHGARRLLLVSRSGARAEGVDELVTELSGLGADVAVDACDVSDRDALKALLARVPDEHPLTGVVHVAGVVHNGLIDSWTPGLVDEGLAPKADAAWHLHELTRDLGLSAFVMFSSAGGLVLAAGQAGYAAANVFLDALAVRRRSEGLPALSMAWGAWALDKGMSSWLSEADLQRLKRQGLPAFTADEALDVFDAALRTDSPVIVPTRLDRAALRDRGEDLPALLRGLARTAPAGRRQTRAEAPASGGGELVARLAELPSEERVRELLTMIRTHAAIVLGHDDPASVDSDRGFLDMGFDSLSALEMRNRMCAATGRRLIPMLLFDYPSPSALAAYFEDELFEKAPKGIDEDLVSITADELFELLDAELETPE
ncbi:SDR family NAD(P)-dependent oxidoreductase, partial [Streptomyces sp. NPDC051921]|uniref:type I polyketide synthase n=1 Tax=Streptomyces sp. NPDC051921 TaxID=3155806 RepID=UPI00341C5927